MKIKKTASGQFSVEFVTGNGKKVSKALNTRNRKEAEKLVKDAKIAELESLAKAGALQRDAIASIVAGRNMKLEAILSEWKEYKKNLSHSQNTIYQQETMINHFLSFSGLKDKGIGDIETSHIKKWLDNKDGTSLAQREQRQSSIRSFLEFAVAAGYSIKDPSKLVSVDKSKLSHKQKEKRKKHVIAEEEYKMLMAKAPYFTRQAVALAWWTGLRISDITSLEWDSWDAKEKTLTVHTQKRDKRVCLPWNDPLIGSGILGKIYQEIDFEDDQYCFPVQREWMKDPKGRSKVSLYFSRLLQRLDIYEKGKGWHSLRSSFVTRCKREGKKLEDIAIWVGHSDTRTTEKYDLTGARL